jgi:hypothetical protein
MSSTMSSVSRNSPRKKGVDNSKCNHCDVAGFENYGNGSHNQYFEEKYLNKTQFFPKHCGVCERRFCLKKSNECSVQEWSVRDGKVRLCKIGANTGRHECTYGLCGECSEKNDVVTPNKRTRKRSLKAR